MKIYLDNIEFLKNLAAIASKNARITPNPDWQEAYKNIQSGAALLWRLIERTKIDMPEGDTEIGDESSEDEAD